MVSHELRAPLTSIKGSAATVLGASNALDPAEMLQFFRIVEDQADQMRGLIQRPPGRRTHRNGHAVGHARAGGGGGPGGPGPQDVPERGRRRPAPRAHRPAAGPAAGDGRPPAHRPGPEQPLLQRRPALSRGLPHPRRGGASRRARGGLRRRRGARRAPGPVAAPVPEARRRHGRRRRAAGTRRPRSGPGHLQGAGRGPRGPHLGRERGDRSGHAGHFHDSGGRRGGDRDRRGPRRFPPAGRGPAGRAHPRGRRRPPDAAVRAGRPRRGGLRPPRDGRPPAGFRDPPDAQAPVGPPRPDAAGGRRHRADGARPRIGRPARHLHLRLPPRRDNGAGPGGGRRRLHRQAVLADRADGEGPGRPAQERRARYLRAGGPGHRLRAAPGVGGRPRGAVDGHRVRGGPRALGPGGPHDELRVAAATGVEGSEVRRRLETGAGRREADPAASWATKRPGRRTSSRSGASATACRRRTTRPDPRRAA